MVVERSRRLASCSRVYVKLRHYDEGYEWRSEAEVLVKGDA